MNYDVIIVGASFAGLAVATRLRGRVLIIDAKPLGSEQTSACATLVRSVESLGAQEAILQVHPYWALHLRGHTRAYPLAYPFCTVSYEKICQILFHRSSSEFLLAKARGLKDGKVLTTEGEFSAPFIVDASGWRAVLASACQPGFVRQQDLVVGIETEVPFADSGLHFWLFPHYPGYFWHFPCDERTRFGVITYRPRRNLKGDLATFMHEQFGLALGPIHGGQLPTRLRRPVIGHLFVVGDAAGQCLGLTGEGIRLAFRFGQLLGDLIQCCLDGALSREAALQEYEAQVRKHQRTFQIMTFLQKVFPYLPLFLMDWVAGAFEGKRHDTAE